MNIWKLASVTIALVLSASANASLVSRNLHNEGDGLITYDNVSNLQWLDITETLGRSYEDISSQLGVQGEFSTWRYATLGEAQGLFMQFGFKIEPWSDNYYNNATIDSYVNDMVSLLGNSFGSATKGVWGLTPPQSPEPNPIGLYVMSNGPWTQQYVETYGEYYGGVSNSLGSFLVRTAVVPIPAAVWLFGSGLIGLVGFARRQKA